MKGTCEGCGQEVPGELASLYAEIHEFAVSRVSVVDGLAAPLRPFEEFVADWLVVHGRSCAAYLEQQVPGGSLEQVSVEADDLWPVLPEHLRRVLSCLLRGQRNGEIMREMRIAAGTLKGYRSDLIRAFGVGKVEQVVAKASQLGWLEELTEDVRGR